jgi:hypothetical protein
MKRLFKLSGYALLAIALAIFGGLYEMGEDKKNPDWLELAKIAQQSFFNRREIEWKLSLGFWTAIAAFSWMFFKVDCLYVPPCFGCWLGFGYLFLFILTIPFWHLPLQRAHGADKRYLNYYLKRARGIDDPKFREGNGTWEDVDKDWFYGHLAFTLFFLLLSWVVITQLAVPTLEAKAEKAKVASQSSNVSELPNNQRQTDGIKPPPLHR